MKQCGTCHNACDCREAAHAAKVAELEALLKQCEEVAIFYANPFNRIDYEGDIVRVPDFYSELCFGERAAYLLKAIRARREGGA